MMSNLPRPISATPFSFPLRAVTIESWCSCETMGISSLRFAANAFFPFAAHRLRACSPYWLRRLGRSRSNFDPSRVRFQVDDCGDRSGMGRSLLQGACCFIFASYTARQLVGISVGIGNKRRQKFIQIQRVMALGGYRPGTDHGAGSTRQFQQPVGVKCDRDRTAGMELQGKRPTPSAAAAGPGITIDTTAINASHNATGSMATAPDRVWKEECSSRKRAYCPPRPSITSPLSASLMAPPMMLPMLAAAPLRRPDRPALQRRRRHPGYGYIGSS